VTTRPRAFDPGAFRPRPPWRGGDLQTLRNVLTRTEADLDPWPVQRRWVDLPDGDRLPVAGHQPQRPAGRPAVLLIHGLTGCEDSIHVRVSAYCFLTRGYPVLRLNLCGSPPARPTCRGHYHAGKTVDLAAAIEQLAAADGMVAVGYSLGGNLLLKHLGESGSAAGLRAAVAVSAPIDLAATSARMRRPRNRLYHDFLLRRMREEATAAGAALTEAERRGIEGARDILEFDNDFIAPRFGFDGAPDYYARCSAEPGLSGIVVPTLAIHARDDPWVDSGAYDRLPWADWPAIDLAYTEKGGHVGFHGADEPVPWRDRLACRFFDEICV